MSKTETIEVTNSWMITQRNIVIAELKYNEEGLVQGTKLKSNKSGEEWTIKGRLISGHAADKQKRFPNETEVVVQFSFSSKEKIEKSISDVIEKEKQGIFEYQLEPIGHSNKPVIGELLEIIL